MNAEQLRRKEAKQAFKNRQRVDKTEREQTCEQPDEGIYNGILHGEDVLPPDYPIHYGYLYVLDFGDGIGKVISSNRASTVEKVLAAIQVKTPTAKNLRRCNIAARNLF